MTYPHTIDDGHGSRMTFHGIARDGRGERLEVSGSVDPGAGPPMHVHHLQSETLTVQSGRVGVSVAGEPDRYVEAGGTVHFPAGVAHRFWNAGETELMLTGEAQPPLNLEWFLTQLYASSARNGGRPGAFDGAYLATRYREEFDVLTIPAPVRRFILPVVLRVGRALGRYGRFADAPTPARRGSGATLPGRSATSARSSAG